MKCPNCGVWITIIAPILRYRKLMDYAGTMEEVLFIHCPHCDKDIELEGNNTPKESLQQ